MPKNTMFSFISIPRNAKELCAMPEYHMKSPFARAALTVLVLCHYSISPEDTIEMLNLLSGPSTLSAADISALSKSLNDHEYIPYSFFANATPENGYEPSLPFVISVRDTAFSYKEPGFATVYVQSSGAEPPRSIQLRKKSLPGNGFCGIKNYSTQFKNRKNMIHINSGLTTSHSDFLKLRGFNLFRQML